MGRPELGRDAAWDRLEAAIKAYTDGRDAHLEALAQRADPADR